MCSRQPPCCLLGSFVPDTFLGGDALWLQFGPSCLLQTAVPDRPSLVESLLSLNSSCTRQCSVPRSPGQSEFQTSVHSTLACSFQARQVVPVTQVRCEAWEGWCPSPPRWWSVGVDSTLLLHSSSSEHTLEGQGPGTRGLV